MREKIQNSKCLKINNGRDTANLRFLKNGKKIVFSRGLGTILLLKPSKSPKLQVLPPFSSLFPNFEEVMLIISERLLYVITVETKKPV